MSLTCIAILVVAPPIIFSLIVYIAHQEKKIRELHVELHTVAGSKTKTGQNSERLLNQREIERLLNADARSFVGCYKPLFSQHLPDRNIWKNALRAVKELPQSPHLVRSADMTIRRSTGHDEKEVDFTINALSLNMERIQMALLGYSDFQESLQRILNNPKTRKELIALLESMDLSSIRKDS